MFIKNLIQRKLASLLQPWLLQEPELELKLGFLRSHGIAKNLRLDTSVLNQLLDDSSSFHFTDFRIDQLTLRISNWSVPAFNFEVRGFHVTVAPRVVDGGRDVRRSFDATDTLLEHRKKVLSEIDPEGSALHDVMERIAQITLSRSRATSFSNLLVSYCCLQICDIDLQAESAPSDKSFRCLWEIKELSADSRLIKSGCFLSGYFSSLFVPLKDSYIDLEIRGLMIKLKNGDHVSLVSDSTDILCSMKLKDLRLTNFHCVIEELGFSFSPADVVIISEFMRQLSGKLTCKKNGRQLWKETAERIRSLISTRRWSMWKLVSVVCLWLRYIHAYENLLLLVGYPLDTMIKRSAMKMSEDQVHSRSFKCQWKEISEIEKEIPIPAIALARRVVRYKAAKKNVIQVKDELPVTCYLVYFQKIVQLLGLFCSMFNSIIDLLLLRKNFAANPNMKKIAAIPNDSFLDLCYRVKLGKISITISPDEAGRPYVGRKAASDVRVSYSDVLSICLLVDEIILIYNDNLCENRLAFSCGSFKVLSSSAVGANANNYRNSVKGRQKHKVVDPETMLWGKPALVFNQTEAAATCANHSKMVSFTLLESLLHQMWLDWKISCEEFEKTTDQLSENPFILCEIKGLLTDEGSNHMGCLLSKCSLAVGELDVFLGYSSTLSSALLLWQIQNAFSWTASNESTRVFTDTSISSGDPPVKVWDYDLYIIEMEKALHKLLPQKLIQVGVFIVGPQVQLSLRKDSLHNRTTTVLNGADDLHLVFDFRDIELIISSNLASNVTQLNEAAPDFIHLKELEVIDFGNSDDIYQCQGHISLDGSLKVHGLFAHLDDSSRCQQSQIISLNPITIQVSTVRKEIWSLAESVIAFSAALHGISMGLSVLMFMDELLVLVEVFNKLTFALSRAFNTIGSSCSVNSQDIIGQEILHVGSEKWMQVSTGNGSSLLNVSTLHVFNCSAEIQPVDVVIHKSRKGNVMENQVTVFEPIKWENQSMHLLPDNGIHISVQKLHMEYSSKNKDKKVEGLADFSGLQAIIFRYANDIVNWTDQFDLHNLSPESLDWIHEVSVSNCTFTFSLRSLPTELSLTHGSNTAQDSIAQLRNPVFPVSNSCLHVSIVSTEIYLVECPVKEILVGTHQTRKLEISLSVDGGSQTVVSFQCQGGIIFLETISAVMCLQFLNSYLHCIKGLLPVASSFDKNLMAAPGANMATVEVYPGQEMQTVHQQAKWQISEDLTVDLSQFSLAFLARDESGRIQELLSSADMHWDLKLVDTRKRFSFGLHKLSVLSRVLQETNNRQNDEVQIPLMSSSTSGDPSFHLISGDTKATLQKMEEIHSVPGYASCSNSDSSKEPHNGDLHQGPQNYILKNLSCFIAAESSVQSDAFDALNPNRPWVGTGSISGLDMTFSLPEMQVILSAAEFSGLSSEETMGNTEQRVLHNNEEPVQNLQEIAPDGTIIAIQDVHQHMYIAVEGAESKYRLVGAMHYSLAGVMALFKVNYHYPKIWKSANPWLSLTSFHAKGDSGEPLRLNCNPRSGFVEISSCGNSGSSHWQALPCKSTIFEDDSELESYNSTEKSLFYLVNRKNNCSIAFVDGVLEFVSKPGNPFKWKVFQDISLTRDPFFMGSSSVETSKTDIQGTSHADENKSSRSPWDIPCINFTVDKFSLTINHELSETREKLPLLKTSIAVLDSIIQIVQAKARVITRFMVEIYSFDAQRNLWSTFVHPVEISIFYRSRIENQGSENVLHGVPVHFYARVKELRISISELSLDILLFVIGKLNLAGPYAVRSSVILANCCKVENQSGLFLLCQFSDQQYASIARKQSTVVFLRNLALNQPPEASVVSIQFAERGAFSTSPIQFSFLHAQTFAWRTRIVSKNDSKTFPGPFIVVEISRKAEDGLSIVVSPLLRIHNYTDFAIELRFQRPEQEEDEHASFVLKAGDTIDDSTAAFDAIKASGGSKKALISLSVGNFVFSFRPKIGDDSPSSKKSALIGWSDELKGGKAARLSGLFDKISYHVRKAFPVESAKSSFSTAHSSIESEDGVVDNIHFLIQSTRRDVPILQPNSSGSATEKVSPVAIQEQKEIYILPTVQISNLLQSEIHVLLTDKELYSPRDSDNMSKEATLSSGSTVNLYSNPEAIFVTVTLTAFGLSCKPINCGDWAKKLLKQKKNIESLDMELSFSSGKYFAFLRLSCGHRGMLEAAIFTSYTLKNNSDFGLFCLAPNQNPLSRDETKKLGSGVYSELGAFLSPKSAISWFMRTNKVRLKLSDDKAIEALLDLDALSGVSEIDLEVEEGSGFKYITKLGVSLRSSVGKVVPSQVVSFSPRYVVVNESEEVITVRQCYLEDDMEGMTTINSKQRKALRLCNRMSKKRETTIFENFIRKHRNAQDDTLLFIQFRPNEAGLGWSGPVCVSSLGRFFLKFRRSADFRVQEVNRSTVDEKDMREFAVVTMAEEDSTLVLRFHRPPNMNLPYRIENCLRDASITYYQKGSSEPEALGSSKLVNYVWDDLTLPHKLVIQISDVHLLREINLDKVRAWKPFYKAGQNRALGFHLPLDKKAGDRVKQTSFGHLKDIERMNLGYEVYADGLTRVLRVCELNDSSKLDRVFYPGAKMTIRISSFAIHLCEQARQEEDLGGPIIVMRLGNISLDSMLTDQHKLNHIRVQSLSVEQKWLGAPFAAMLRRHQTEYLDTCPSMLRVVLILLPSRSNIRQVKYSSIVLQPIDLNLDEETLMRIVPFWRTSLSDPNAPSQQYYFDHFEIHPVKIIASFLPGDSYSSYNSTQETLRSLLHTVIKVPEIKNKTVELNGVLVTHALITIRELSIKCAQHYSWYVMRAIYMAKGSPLLPPAFASIFDDLASSSLDVFFDPSSGLVKLPGLTLGTFKLLSKCIDGKGFSGTKRYFGDLGKTLKTAGSNILFAAVTEISDSVLKGAEASGFNGMIIGFHQGILKLAMEPSLLGSAFMEGGPDRKIKLDRNPGVDELYIEGYLQAMLDTIYKQEYLRVRVIENQVVLKNLPPNSALIDEIMDRVKGFLVSKALLKGETSSSHPFRHLRGESEWKIGPTILTLCEHLFVSFAIRWLRKQADPQISKIKWQDKLKADNDQKGMAEDPTKKEEGKRFVWRWGIGKFVLSGIVAYIDGRLCRAIPNPIARRIVSGFLLSFLDKKDDK